ncbi:MAG TPA: ankyrin repeat domain-containing protein [Blastocatellia bacterium]|nr:ankyrin repeat domain-containing protein [Blastocatellia bacterium]
MGDLQLIDAVKAGDAVAAKELIASGIDVGQQDEQGWTPLNWAAGRGDIAIVKLLIENGADVFKVGRDQRTPYQIALAAGRVEVVEYLRQAEDRYPGDKPARVQRPYCKAYHLRDLRQFPTWAEVRANWKAQPAADDGAGGQDAALTDDDVVFIHQDFTVTQSMWHAENVIFDQVSREWEAYCTDVLNFKVPDDLDYITVANSQ